MIGPSYDAALVCALNLSVTDLEKRRHHPGGTR